MFSSSKILVFSRQIGNIIYLSICPWWCSGHAIPKDGTWYIECFKLKEFEKRAVSGKSLTMIFSLPFSPGNSYKASCERCPPHAYSKRAPYIWRQRDTGKNLIKQAFLTFPQCTVLTSYSLPYHISPQLVVLHQT